MVNDILNMLRNRKLELTEKYAVNEIGIFGSYSRGEERLGSDLDILVTFKDGSRISLDLVIDLKQYLESIFHKKVDLVQKDALKSIIRGNILNEVKYA
jgi:predicted nucleotidyltransferase